ncbi:MAG: hypothetical protein KDK70_11920 [Myxococcales bacterium]|nr:hypothetical protein [Myxococcales bacterium]
MTTGCADRAFDYEPDEVFEERGGAAGSHFWEWGLNFEANGPIEVYDGEDDDAPDCLIWDIDTAGVARQVQPGEFSDLMSLASNEIYDIDPVTGQAGVLQCTAEEAGGGLDKHYKLLNADGTVALTVWQRFVFLGDVNIPPFGNPGLVNLLQNNVAFSFKHEHIYAGNWWSGSIAASATANLNMANPMRRLLLGALAAGECGSTGLPY